MSATLALALMGLASSCIMPANASRPASGGVSLALADPLPYDPAQAASLFMPAAPLPLPGEDAASLFEPTMLIAGPAAGSYIFRGRNAEDALRASSCLTAALYYEAGNEPEEGLRAVAQVVLNRVRSPAYPNTVCGVVYQGTERNDTLCQFTFGCDGSMARIPSSAAWARANRIAREALTGSVYAPVGLSTFYHTRAVNPGWNRRLTPTAIVGAHIFYRWPGGAGEPRAFTASYRGFEPHPGPKPKLPLPPGAAPAVATALDFPVVAAPVPAHTKAGPAPATSVAQDRRYVAGSLPESEIMPEYQNSGQWITR